MGWGWRGGYNYHHHHHNHHNHHCAPTSSLQREKTATSLAALTNLRTKFHEDWTINVISRAFTRKTALPPVSHVFQRTGTIFKFSRAIIRTNLRTKFHEDWTINVISRVLTRKTPPPLMAMKMTPPPPGGHVLLPIRTIFKLNLFTCFHYIHIEKTALPPGGHVFSPI
ncbi:hypothetical protein DPMN_165109 [Dreissena polymorpha]|uniref:Uncharacterized protein n=1 Tax=Dreissena polymorpha TaxID=45954 RepID=A0A9D4EZP6_DREPO|nr:hypothetical protein DPMN_165109 [Dreissena polymorpha]